MIKGKELTIKDFHNRLQNFRRNVPITEETYLLMDIKSL